MIESSTVHWSNANQCKKPQLNPLTGPYWAFRLRDAVFRPKNENCRIELKFSPHLPGMKGYGYTEFQTIWCRFSRPKHPLCRKQGRKIKFFEVGFLVLNIVVLNVVNGSELISTGFGFIFKAKIASRAKIRRQKMFHNLGISLPKKVILSPIVYWHQYLQLTTQTSLLHEFVLTPLQ